MNINATQFRKNMYQLLKGVVDTGTPLKINLKDNTFVIFPEGKVSKLDKLKPQKLISDDSDELLNIDWSKEWSKKFI